MFEFATGANLKCWICAARITSLAETSVHDKPSVDFSKSPLDSTTVIVIDFNAVSPSSTSVNGKSEVAYPVNVVSSVPD